MIDLHDTIDGTIPHRSNLGDASGMFKSMVMHNCIPKLS